MVLDCNLNHGAEIIVVLAPNADVARIDAVLGQRFGTGGVFLEQDVSVVVEVADDRHADGALIKLLDDIREGGGSVFIVDGDAH